MKKKISCLNNMLIEKMCHLRNNKRYVDIMNAHMNIIRKSKKARREVEIPKDCLNKLKF